MNSEFYEEVPVLSREEAIAILNTPNDELNTLIDHAKNLRYKRRFFWHEPDPKYYRAS